MSYAQELTLQDTGEQGSSEVPYNIYPPATQVSSIHDGFTSGQTSAADTSHARADYMSSTDPMPGHTPVHEHFKVVHSSAYSGLLQDSSTESMDFTSPGLVTQHMSNLSSNTVQAEMHRPSGGTVDGQLASNSAMHHHISIPVTKTSPDLHLNTLPHYSSLTTSGSSSLFHSNTLIPSHQYPEPDSQPGNTSIVLGDPLSNPTTEATSIAYVNTKQEPESDDDQTIGELKESEFEEESHSEQEKIIDSSKPSTSKTTDTEGHQYLLEKVSELQKRIPDLMSADIKSQGPAQQSDLQSLSVLQTVRELLYSAVRICTKTRYGVKKVMLIDYGFSSTKECNSEQDLDVLLTEMRGGKEGKDTETEETEQQTSSTSVLTGITTRSRKSNAKKGKTSGERLPTFPEMMQQMYLQRASLPSFPGGIVNPLVPPSTMGVYNPLTMNKSSDLAVLANTASAMASLTKSSDEQEGMTTTTNDRRKAMLPKGARKRKNAAVKRHVETVPKEQETHTRITRSRTMGHDGKNDDQGQQTYTESDTNGDVDESTLSDYEEPPASKKGKKKKVPTATLR